MHGILVGALERGVVIAVVAAFRSLIRDLLSGAACVDVASLRIVSYRFSVVRTGEQSKIELCSVIEWLRVNFTTSFLTFSEYFNLFRNLSNFVDPWRCIDDRSNLSIILFRSLNFGEIF